MKRLVLMIFVGALLFAFAPLRVTAADLNIAVLQKELQESVVNAEIPELYPSQAQQLIARSTFNAFRAFHYTHPAMTPAFFSSWYVNYFQILDPGKIYFLQSDLADFSDYVAQMSRRNQPDLEFAFQVYRRFLERVREWAIFTFEEYSRPCDFTVDETLEVFDNPEDHDWPATDAERKRIWRLRVKNALLNDRLTQEEMEARRKTAPEEETAEHKAVYTPPPIRLRNQNAVINSFRNRLNADAVEVMSLFLNACAMQMDPHTNYLAPEMKEDFDILMSLSLQGIGATLSTRDSYTVVVSLVPGGPAALDGHLRPGDRILAVAQSENEEPLNVVDMQLSKVVKKIRGPKGTSVWLTVQPEGSFSEYVLKLTRDEIKLKDSEAQSTVELVDGKRVLCLYLPGFYRDFSAKEGKKSMTEDVLRLMQEARTTGPIDGIVLDMRDNGGGSLEEAIQLCGLFLKPGDVLRPNAVVQTRDSEGRVQVRYAPREELRYDGPLMVLVDRGAASATEIVAACLQDTQRAVVVGDPRTHGKGSVQMVLDLTESSDIRRNRALLGKTEPGSIKITIQKFYRVTGGSTQIRGVTPDICFPSFRMASRSSEIDLPHALKYDEITPASFRPQTALVSELPTLRAFYEKYALETPEFRQYAKEVEEYCALREKRDLPLEINARRALRERETAGVRRVRHYQPDRAGEERERLHDADEELYDDGGPRQDVVMDAALQIMGKMLEIDANDPQKPFCVK